jgi:hypothetical protein
MSAEPNMECFIFRDTGECRFGEACRFKHGEADERTLGGRRSP